MRSVSTFQLLRDEASISELSWVGGACAGSRQQASHTHQTASNGLLGTPFDGQLQAEKWTGSAWSHLALLPFH